MWRFFIENKQQLDKKEKKQSYVILVFFEKNLSPKRLITKLKI